MIPGIYLTGACPGDFPDFINPGKIADYHPFWKDDIQTLAPWREISDDYFLRERDTPLWYAKSNDLPLSSVILIHGKCTSSMDVAAHLLQNNILSPWDSVLAVQQTAGRGQFRRAWISEPGNLCVSWIWPSFPEIPDSRMYQQGLLSLIAAYTTAMVLEKFGIHICIKWPNDLLFHNCKIGGILLEPKQNGIIVGLGLNLASSPSDTLIATQDGLKTTCLCNGNVNLTPLTFWLEMATEGKKWFNRLLQDVEPREFIHLASRRLAWFGHKILISGNTRPRSATIIGLMEDGGLLVTSGSKRDIIYSGRIVSTQSCAPHFCPSCHHRGKTAKFQNISNSTYDKEYKNDMKAKTLEQILTENKGKPILVANRGIPARRICRSISEMEAISIMTATEIDKTSPSTVSAQELMLLGEDPTAYLDIDLIIEKAKERGVIAIHPGWGFAAEDYSFPRKCQESGILFIGPPHEAMRLLGNKVAVRQLAMELDIPVVPGSEGAVTLEEGRHFAEKIGYPIMLKAEGGGGGRGIYEVFSEGELESAYMKASSFAQASFGNPKLFVERLLTSVRHIEIQVVADKYGNVFAFDERDCTVQRNHQKLVEITPSPWPGMTEKLRKQLKDYATRLIKTTHYYSLATVEFLVDMEGNPYLIEVNTRLQVEHGITEVRYGVDLVAEQIAIAFGAQLSINEEETHAHQWAMQVRINCEDPQNNFSPNAGWITRHTPPAGAGIRMNSCIKTGYEFPSQYDSAASLLISFGRSWNKCVKVMRRALREYHVGGIKTTIPFHRQIMKHPIFNSGYYDTKFIEKTPELMCYVYEPPEAIRLSRLVAELSAKGYNEFIQLGQYRGIHDQRIGPFKPVKPREVKNDFIHPYPRYDRQATLDFIRYSGYVHFMDTTTRDITQSNSGNRFRLSEDKLVGPYLDKCGFFSLENGGGAHFHVAMLANMTYPFTEAKKWNEFAPQTMKQILIRSTNVLGYKPQPRNLMQKTGEMICEHYDVIRCFDFLNHIENMRPFAEVVMNSKRNIFEPAISLSHTRGFDVMHYLSVTDEIISMIADVTGLAQKQASRAIILGLKDMAGVCPPRFMRQLVQSIRRKYPELVIHYHRHYTDGLFVPSVGAAAEAGANIVDTGIGAAVRWYGQGEILSTAAYIENELGLKTNLNKDMIRACGFALKQIMPYYDRYCAPYFRGIDYDVVEHGMPGGATSSSQEGAMKQGYIHLLPHMLEFLSGTRKINRYHDVTPGSQITWNTAFLAITGAYQRGGENQVLQMLETLKAVNSTPEEELSSAYKKSRLELYQDCNDAFRDLLLGKFGKMPLGFPPDWVYESAFGGNYKKAIAERTEESPLDQLENIDMKDEFNKLKNLINREPTDEEFVLYLNHPGDALKTFEFTSKFGNPNNIPVDVWFEGLEKGVELEFADSHGKPHQMNILDIFEPDKETGIATVRYLLDSEVYSYQVKVEKGVGKALESVEMADERNLYHVSTPSNGDLWITYVKPGDVVQKGEELFNISIMKQEKAVVAPVDGIVKRVLKVGDYKDSKKMLPVIKGELLIELSPASDRCPNCKSPIDLENYTFCPFCGHKIGARIEK
jgi:pyruvate carboxylase